MPGSPASRSKGGPSCARCRSSRASSRERPTRAGMNGPVWSARLPAEDGVGIRANAGRRRALASNARRVSSVRLSAWLSNETVFR